MISLAKAAFLIFQSLSINVLIPCDWIPALTSYRARHLHLHLLTLHFHIHRGPLAICCSLDLMRLVHPKRRYVTLLPVLLNEYGFTAVATDEVKVEIGPIDDHDLACALLRIAAGVARLLKVYIARVHLDELYLLRVGWLLGVLVGYFH